MYFQFLQEGARIQAQLTLSLTTLAKTKEKYEKVSVSNVNEFMKGCKFLNADTNITLTVKGQMVQLCTALTIQRSAAAAEFATAVDFVKL